MTTIHTAFGDGEIVEVDRGRLGKTRYKVAGFGFEVWLDAADPAVRLAELGDIHHGPDVQFSDAPEAGGQAPFHGEHYLEHWEEPHGLHVRASNPRDRAGDSWAESRDKGWKEHEQQDLEDDGDAEDNHHLGASFDFEPTDHVWDNHTTLPYDWTPQYPVDMFRHEQTQSPDHEIDHDERVHPSDSRSGESREPIHEYPGPAAHLFANKQAWTFHDEEDPNHLHEDERWDELNNHAQHGLEHVAAGWQPPQHPSHDPEFDQFEDYGQHAPEWGPHHPDYDGIDLPPEHRAAPGEPSAQDHVNADAQRLQQQIGSDTSNPAHPDHLPGGGHLGYVRPAGLSNKYADIHDAAVDHYNDPVQRFKDDPYTAIQRHAHMDLASGLDEGAGQEQLWMPSKGAAILRTSAWRDVRSKATRLVREGKVDVHAMDSNAIYANVEGDHGDYEVMILNGSAYPNGGFNGGKRAIANWKCSCDWGKWAFKRQFTFVGRLCSHGYATYLTQQSHHLKSNPDHFTPKKKKVAGVEEFKSWINDENGGHVDIPAADNFLSIKETPVTREEAEAIYDYAESHHSEHPERDYDQDGYSDNPDDAYKGEGFHHAEMLHHQPGKLTPHLYVVPEGEEEHFEDLGDDRKTTGPDQIQAKVAMGESEISSHHPAFAWHSEKEPDFPDGGIVHFSALTFTAEEQLLNRLRELGQTTPAQHPHAALAHNQELSAVVDELHNRGYDASPLVAMKTAAPDDQSDPMGPLQQMLAPGSSPIAKPPNSVDQLLNADTGKQNAPLTPHPTDPTGGLLGGPAGGGASAAGATNPGGGASPGGVGPSAPADQAKRALPGGPGDASDKAMGAAFGPNAGGNYIVKPGDTLSGISQSHGMGGDISGLVKSNPGSMGSGTNISSNPNLIHPGDVIKGVGGGGGAASPASGSSWLSKPLGGGASPAGGGAAGGSSWLGGGSAGATGAGGMANSGVGNNGKTQGWLGHASREFAQRYFLAADSDSSDSDDPNKKNVSTTPQAGGGNQGVNYKPVTNPGQQVNAPRPPAANAQGASLPTSGPVNGHGGNDNAMTGDVHGGVNPLGAPQAGQVSVSGPKGTDSTTSGSPGAGGQQQPQQPGAAGGGAGAGLSQALSIAQPLVQGLAGGLGGIGHGGLMSGLASGIGGMLGQLPGLAGGLGHLGAKDFAAQYFQANGSFLDDDERGPDWMDYPFAGSGPDRQDWSGTSEDYIDEHEKGNRNETWVTDNDGDVVKYTTDRPKQKKANGDLAGSGDAGFASAGPMAGGTLSPSGSGEGLGGSFTHADSSSGAPTMGTLSNTASVSESARQFWADAFSPSEQGFFNPHLHLEHPDDSHFGLPKGKGKGKPATPGGEPAEDSIGGSAAAGIADAAPLLAVASRDDSDVVRRFQAMGGGALDRPNSDPFGDDAIARNAQKMLRTAGRKFTPDEERALEDEFHPRGARNLGDLDLTGTHYLDD